MPPVPGSFAVADWVGMEALRFLQNMLAMAGYADYGYQDEFKKNFAIGDTARIKLPQEYLVTDGFAYNPQGLNRQTTTITIDQPMQIGFGWDSIEEALSLERGKSEISEQYIQPAIGQLASEIELRFMNFAFFNCPNVVGTLGAVPTAWTTYATARQRLVELATWNSTKNVIGVTPAMMRVMIANSITNFNPTDELSKQYKQGSIGKAAGFDWFETMYARRHTTGVIATQASVTVNGASQSGATLNVNCTTGDTFLRGDIISAADVNYVNPRTRVSTGTARQFKITANSTGAASTAALSIYPSITGPGSPYQNVNALPANLAAVTFWPGTTITNGAASTGSLGLAFNKLGYAIAGVELMMPQQGGNVQVAVQKKDKNTGLSIAILSMFEGENRTQINRLDCLVGFGRLYADRASVLVASLN